MKQKNLLFFLPISFSVAILWPASLSPNLFIFESFGFEEVAQLLTFLALIALFLERALEVFINTWRRPGEEEIENDIQSCERKIAESKPEINMGESANENSTKTELEKFNLKRAKYKSQTRKVALWTALFIGLLISGVGIRSLETLIDLKELKEFPPDQQPIFYAGQVCIFRVLDTLLTGGLIAGGSDGIHKITQVFVVFLEETRNKIQSQA